MSCLISVHHKIDGAACGWCMQPGVVLWIDAAQSGEQSCFTDVRWSAAQCLDVVMALMFASITSLWKIAFFVGSKK